MNTTVQAKRLVLVALNEVNFDVAARYVERLGLKSFAALFRGGWRTTSSESRYEQLEPWIQWVSAHSGLTAAEHGIFRLGDVVGSPVPQLFEQLEANGLSVGAVSPMNAENRLRRPAYFLPDPWTSTASDGSFWSRSLSTAISQAVNDNAKGRITARSAAILGLALLRFASFRHYGLYLKLAARSKGAPWRKALFLDLMIHDIHWSLKQERRPNFSSVFLNAGAHIQHHYFFNSPVVDRPGAGNPDWYVARDEDPIAEMLQVYDTILADYLADKESALIVATGLTQVPYDRVKYYYRLRDHAAFLQQMGVRFARVLPRMTRDFVIEFDDEAQALLAQRQLAAFTLSTDGTPLFGEIDNRGLSLFVTLTYPNRIEDTAVVCGGATQVLLAPHVAFVAIKNGMHASHGYVCCHGDAAPFAAADGSHVASLHSTILRFFGIAPRPVGDPG